MEYYASIRKGEYPTFVLTWTGLEEIMLSEISQAERVNYHMVSLTWGAEVITQRTLEVGEEKLGEIGGGGEPWETVDAEKQTEGFGGEGGEGVSLVVGIRRARIAWSTECGA